MSTIVINNVPQEFKAALVKQAGGMKLDLYLMKVLMQELARQGALPAQQKEKE